MAYKYSKASRDGNHASIAADLAKTGVSVLDLSGVGSGVPDLLTLWRGLTCLIELKFETDAAFKRSQLELMARWTGYVGVARNTDEAEQLAKHPDRHALTGRQKDRITQFLVRWQGKTLRINTFYEVINA